jgi:ArsR family transcriptional regulator, arsenate/arsenite/antimonite-responsive transcriptional repressor
VWYDCPVAEDLIVRQLKAIAHPIRLGMLQRLARDSEICACDLGEAFAVSQPTVSEHLRVLREAGLVQTRREGTTICYSAAPQALRELATVIAALRPRTRVKAA